MAVFNLEDEENGIKSLYDKIKSLPQKGEKIVTETLHNEGAVLIKGGIDRILPSSRRTWKGKKSAASSNNRAILKRANESGNLNVVVGTTSQYHYLYFPDDGSNTLRHEGGQHFMLRGAENATGKIINICQEKLIKAIEG